LGSRKIRWSCRNYEGFVDLATYIKKNTHSKRKIINLWRDEESKWKHRINFLLYYSTLQLSTKCRPQTSHVKSLKKLISCDNLRSLSHPDWSGSPVALRPTSLMLTASADRRGFCLSVSNRYVLLIFVRQIAITRNSRFKSRILSDKIVTEISLFLNSFWLSVTYVHN